MGMNVFGALWSACQRGIIFISGQMFGLVIDGLCSAVLLLMTLCTHLWIASFYFVMFLSCGQFCNCVKHNYSASDLEANVIIEQQDSVMIL